MRTIEIKGGMAHAPKLAAAGVRLLKVVPDECELDSEEKIAHGRARLAALSGRLAKFRPECQSKSSPAVKMIADRAQDGVAALRDPRAPRPIDQSVTAAAQGSPSDGRAELVRLAKLDRFEYERNRETEAKRLGVRVTVLDEEVGALRKATTEKASGFLEPPEPWGDPVDGAELLSEIEDTLTRYVVLPDHGASTIALWVLMAHAMDHFEISPILAIESPEKRCGKTTLLSILQPLVPKPLTAANMTPAAVFRAVEAFSPTLVLDEADTFLTADNPELVGILNSGHTRASAFVVRVVGDDHDVKQFRTWCPKAIALIGELPTTLQDRAIAIRMRRRQKRETVERRRADRTGDLQNLCRKAARWVADNAATLKSCDPAMPIELDDRAADNWRPLLTVAYIGGGGWPAKARKAAKVLSRGRADDDESGGVLLLRDIREVLDGDWLTPAALLERLLALPESPWPEWRVGKPITMRGIAKLLKPYVIKSEQGSEGGIIARRYYKSDFVDAWTSYLPAAPQFQVVKR